MRRLTLAAAAVLLTVQVVASTSFADQAQQTLAGNIVCAKCTLKVQGLKECQNVLLVKNEAGQDTQYWLAKNDVNKSFGEVCETVKPVVVTGTVEQKEGKNWLTATKIEPQKGS